MLALSDDISSLIASSHKSHFEELIAIWYEQGSYQMLSHVVLSLLVQALHSRRRCLLLIVRIVVAIVVLVVKFAAIVVPVVMFVLPVQSVCQLQAVLSLDLCR